jgi:hypothetical protein
MNWVLVGAISLFEKEKKSEESLEEGRDGVPK